MKQKIHNRPPRAIVLLLALICSISTFNVFAEIFTYEGINYEVLYSQYRAVEVSKNSSATGDVVIPETVTYYGSEYRVKEIGYRAFGGCTGLTSITLPNSVTSIGDFAFDDCTDLTSITLPSSVTKIGWSAFYGCTGLISITLPNSLISIGEGAFYYCDGLTSITIPSSVTSIGSGAFFRCKSLQSINVESDNPNYTSNDGVLLNKDQTSIITFPQGKSGNYSIPSSVTSIGESTFEGRTGLTSIEIPSSVTSIGNYAFKGCTGLTSMEIPSSVTSIGDEAFKNCTRLFQVSIPNSVTMIGKYAFEGCSGLQNVFMSTAVTSIAEGTFKDCTQLYYISLPESLTSIGRSSFYGCTGLTTITIPNSVTSIGSEAFHGCKGLMSITIPSSVTKIGWGAFEGCTGLTSLEIPSSVTSIGSYAFCGCTGLTSITIPESVTEISWCAFSGCTLNPLLILSKDCEKYDSKVFSGLSDESTIVAYNNYYIREAIKGSKFKGICVFDTDGRYYESDINTTLLSASFKINKNPLFEYEQYEYDLEIENGTPDQKITGPDENGFYKVTGLMPNTSYKVKINYRNVNDTEDKGFIPFLLTTKKYKFGCIANTTQTTVTITNLKFDSTDEKPDRIGVIYDGKEYEYTGDPIKISNLEPNSYLVFNYYAYFGDVMIRKEFKVWTDEIEIYISAVSGPTTLHLTGRYTQCDAKVVEVGFIDYPKGANVTVTGLTPNSSSEYTFYVKTEKGSYSYESKRFTTSPLELKILQPKCVSQNCAIVAAETNIEDEEPNVGFEWKKYDAPETLPAKEGYGAVYNGMLEGYIKNLQSTSYYNVRAFYKDSAGKYYYSDWITFDPSDFSFFEPTVHTYPIENVKEHSATVRGYVLAGTDNIKRQGVQYWPEKSGSQIRFNAPAASDIVTVEATGQSMTIELDNLRAGTTYVCRAFVETAAGYTYGEEQKFTTPQTTGVEDVIVGTSEAEPATIVGYYDLTGKRYDEPRHGFNIVLYSDGTTRKIYVNADR